jgi:hypothetical protein
MRRQRAGEMADAALELTVGSKTAVNTLALIARSIDAWSKDRTDTTEAQRGPAIVGVPLYPPPPGGRE